MTTPQRSALAAMQRALTLGAVAALLVWLWFARGSLAWQLVGVALFLWGHAMVLGLEFVLMACVNRRDPAPRATWGEWLRAWWAESLTAPRVFSWWQPFRWRMLPDTAVGECTFEGRRAVVLVHGFVCNRGLWMPWLRELRARGVPYATVSLEPVFGSIDGYVPQLQAAIERATRATGQPPLVVAHSMGGLVVRAWLRATGAGAEARIHHVVTLGTPHRGTWLGRLSRVPNGRQMNDQGDWVSALSAAESPPLYQRFTCWYSNCDNIVFPVSTATLPGADNRFLRGVPHVAMAYHPAVMKASLAML